MAAYLVYAVGLARRHRAEQPIRRIEVRVADSTAQMRLVSSATVKGWIAHSGIPTVGATVGDIDLGALERMIAGNGFVADARASVTYSGVLQIAVNQRTPLMRLLVDGYNSYVTEEGYIFAAPRLSSAYVPVVTGSYRPLFPPGYMGDADDYTQALWQVIEEQIEVLEREKYPLYRREIKNDENTRAARQMRVKKGWFESKESFAERVQQLREHKEQLRRNYRYEGQMIQAEIDKISEKQEARRHAQKKLLERAEDFRKLTNFVKWIEEDDFWRAEIVQLTVYTSDSGAIEVALTPRSGGFTILFGRLEEAPRKFDKLARFYRAGLSRTGWERYREIDVRYAGQVICRE